MADVSGLRRHSKVVKVAEIVAREVERELKQTAPVDSGELRRLITTEVRKTVAARGSSFGRARLCRIRNRASRGVGRHHETAP